MVSNYLDDCSSHGMAILTLALDHRSTKDDDWNENTTTTTTSLVQTYILAVFFFPVKGHLWERYDSWLSYNRNYCEGWYGIECDSENENIIGLTQESIQGGHIANELFHVSPSSLRSLKLGGNFAGTLSSYEFARLTNLERLEITSSGSLLLGPIIPVSIGLLTN